ncbi:MAG: T9SS type A sorting domain-containing protein, partial [Ignavibacteriae bacterium]|nr:T9SS type A sorting domain-containing protein [Ignavibacteriota bacterium]
IPKEIIIAQNYPNPFNPSTVIRFTIPQNLSNSPTKLTIYNIQGEVVKELLNEKLQAGTYLTKWNGDNQFGKMVSSGIYFYKIKVGEHTVVGKMNLVK